MRDNPGGGAGDLDPLAVARVFYDAVESGDLDRVRATYGPSARINVNDAFAMSVEENMAMLERFTAIVGRRRYDERRLSPHDVGFVQQHVLRGVTDRGEEVSLPTCAVGHVVGGRLVQLDEYFDSAAIAHVMTRLEIA